MGGGGTLTPILLINFSKKPFWLPLYPIVLMVISPSPPSQSVPVGILAYWRLIYQILLYKNRPLLHQASFHQYYPALNLDD